MDCTMNIVTRVITLTPTKKVYETLYEMWSRVNTSVAHIKVYDYEVYAHREALDNLEQ